MRVVFLKDIKGVGRTNEIKNVSDGYARNFLIPKGLAKPATEGDITRVQKIEASDKDKIAMTKEALRTLQKETESAPIKLYIKTGKKGEIFSSVKGPDIESVLLREKPHLSQLEIKIKTPKPIKELGPQKIEISAPQGIKNYFYIEILPIEEG